MVIHIALFAWKQDVAASVVDEALEEVRRLRDKVPGLVSISCGTNVSRWNEGFTHGVVVIAESFSALEAYRNHPDHMVVGKLIDSLEERSIGVDFEDQTRYSHALR
jgi:hypothetical protein